MACLALACLLPGLGLSLFDSKFLLLLSQRPPIRSQIAVRYYQISLEFLYVCEDFFCVLCAPDVPVGSGSLVGALAVEMVNLSAIVAFCSCFCHFRLFLLLRLLLVTFAVVLPQVETCAYAGTIPVCGDGVSILCSTSCLLEY